MRKFLRVLCFAMLLTLMASPAFAETIKIGLMAPLTGPWASEGRDMERIVQLLASEINNSGGINGNTIEILVEDDGGTPRTATQAATKLTTLNPVAVIGTYGSAVTEASQNIYDEAGVVQIATGSTSIRLTEKNLDKFFRTCPRDDQQGQSAVKVLQDMGLKKIAILHDNTSYSKGLADEIKDGLEKSGKDVKIVFFDALRPGEHDYSTILTKLKGIDPDGIMFTGYYPEAAMLLRQMQGMKWSVPMVGGDATNNSDLVKIAGDAATGYYFLSPPLPSDIDPEGSKAFLDAYHKAYDAYPNSVWAIAAGDAFKVLVEAIKAGNTTPESIANYLHKDLKDFVGLSGVINFNAKGDRTGDLYSLYKVDEKGNFIIQR